MSAARLSADDRLDIMDLIARYAYTLDQGDLDGYSTISRRTACSSWIIAAAMRFASTWAC